MKVFSQCGKKNDYKTFVLDVNVESTEDVGSLKKLILYQFGSDIVNE